MRKTEINVRWCREQVSRLAATRYWDGVSPRTIIELENVLLLARDHAMAEAVVSHWILEHEDRPTPYNLKQLIGVMDKASQPKKPEPCEKCEALGGFVRVEVGLVSGVFECDCALGQYLAAGKTKHKAESAAPQPDSEPMPITAEDIERLGTTIDESKGIH